MKTPEHRVLEPIQEHWEEATKEQHQENTINGLMKQFVNWQLELKIKN